MFNFFNKRKKKEEYLPTEEEMNENPPVEVSYVMSPDGENVFLDVYTSSDSEESIIKLAKVVNSVFSPQTQALTVETIKNGLINSGRSDLVDIFVKEIIKQSVSNALYSAGDRYSKDPCVWPSDLMK